ncbi:MAG: pilus assembly protein N-terminal domain-containing protein [Xanthobacteraceae bacterium]
MSNLWVRVRAGTILAVPLAATLALAVAGAPAFADGPITVQLDRATIIRLPERAATVVIGDPLIADLSLQPHGLAVITGKGFGATNIIVLDHGGAVLSEQTVEVQGPTDPTVVVYRGVARQTYSCTPECLPRITLGDDSDYFNKTLDESTTRTTQASAAGARSDSASTQNGDSKGIAPPPPQQPAPSPASH